MTFFDARLDRTEQLDDVALVYYLTMKKKGKPVLSGIEKVYSVTTTAFWVYASPTATSSTTAAASNPGAARAKVAFVRIVGQSPESVDAAWKRLCAHLATVVRRRTQFTFLREEVLFRACFKRKLKPLFWRYASTAMHVDDPEDGGVAQSVVVIHIVGPSAQEVARLAQEPNHIRTRLVGERSQPVLASPQQLDLAALEKEFDVAVAADWNAKQLKVVGYRDSVRACLAHVHALCAKATAGAESAAPATTAGNPHATAAATPTAPAAAPAPAAAKPQAQREFTKTIEFAPIEAAAVQRLNLSVVRSKFGVYTKVNMAKRTITFTGPVAPALETASSFVRSVFFPYPPPFQEFQQRVRFTLTVSTTGGSSTTAPACRRSQRSRPPPRAAPPPPPPPLPLPSPSFLVPTLLRVDFLFTIFEQRRIGSHRRGRTRVDKVACV